MDTAIERGQSTRTVDFKGRMVTLNVIRVRSDDLHRVSQDLEDKVSQAPDFFRHLPVLIDLDQVPSIELGKVCDIFRQQHLAVLGLIGGNPELDQRAKEMGVVVLAPGAMGADRSSKSKPAPTATAKDEEQEQADNQAKEAAANADAALTPTLLIKHPVRSGQQVYARGGDLIVLASVGAGAEVLADGHVHIYGPLRGRALAGVQGDTQARIFCQNLEAELISVAGSYIISDDIPTKFREKSVQISLGSNDLLRIDPL